MLKKTGSKSRFYWLLAAIMVVAALIRLVGFDWGLPKDRFHSSMEEDEEIFLQMVRGMDISRLDMDPNFYMHAPMVAYLWELSLGVARVFNLADHKIDNETFAKNPRGYRRILLAGRAVSFLLGLAFVAFTAILFRRWVGPDASLLAAAFLAVFWEPVNHSHIVRHDLPLSLVLLFITAQGFYLANLGRRRDYLVMGALLGVALSVIHAGGVSLGGPLYVTAHLLWLHKSGKLQIRHLPSRRFFEGLGAAALVAVAMSPFLIYNLPDVISVYKEVLGSSARETDLWRVTRWTQGFGGGLYLIFYMIPLAFGFLFTPLALGALIYYWVKRRGKWLLLIIIPSLHLLLLMVLTQKFTRHLLFSSAPLALLAARFALYDFKEILRQKIGAKADGLIWAMCAVILFGSFLQTAAVLYLSEKMDIPEAVASWMEKSVEDGAVIATIDHPVHFLIPPLDPRFFPDSKPRYSILEEMDHNKENLKNSKAEYLIDPVFLIRGLHNKYLKERPFEQEKEFIRWLDSGEDFRKIKTFSNDPGWMGFVFNTAILPLDLHRVNLEVVVYKRNPKTTAPPVE